MLTVVFGSFFAHSLGVFFSYGWSCLLTLGAFLLTVGAFLLTVGKYI